MTDNSLQSADKDQHEMRAVAEKPHDAVVKFDRPAYRNVQRHRAVFRAIARLSFCYLLMVGTRHVQGHQARRMRRMLVMASQ